MLTDDLDSTVTGYVDDTSWGDRPFLIVLESPVAGEPGRIVTIGSRLTIGRSSAQLIVKDAMLSKRHAEIVYVDGICRIHDLGSRNGTRVNGTRVSASELRPGDQIRIGATVLLYQDGTAADSHQSILGALGDSGVALWEYVPASHALEFSEHADPALELPRSTLGRARVPIHACIHPDDHERFERALEVTRHSLSLELEVRLKLASIERWVTLRGKRSAAGTVVGTIVNITGSKRREATLTRTALMFESFSDGVVLADDDSVIVDVNLAMTRAFGVNKRDATGRAVFAIVPVSEPSRQLNEIREAVERTGRWSGTLSVPTGMTDQLFEVQVFSLLTDRGESAGTAWVFHDVTERSRMQGQIAFLDRLASLGTMSAGVAHEINNPLTFVLANAQFVLGMLSPEHHAPMVEAMEELIEGTERIGKIVNDLKTFARAGSSSELTATNVESAIQLAIKMSRSINGSRARIETSFESTRHVNAVESHLVQILVNLVSNAVQSLPDGQVPTVTIRTFDDKAGVAIEVIDDGMGMSAEIAARAFDPFFTTRPLQGGTGLGLSICHGLVTQMAGTISLHSVVGRGTTVRVWLHRAAAPGPQIRQPPIAAAQRLRILVVDDEPLLLRALQRMLSDQDVVTANGYTEATRVLLDRRESFDSILCDLMMPDGSGMELHARLVAERPDLTSRMVFFTGAAFTDEAQRFLDSVTTPHLFKPVDRTTLRRVLFEAASPAALPGSS